MMAVIEVMSGMKADCAVAKQVLGPATDLHTYLQSQRICPTCKPVSTGLDNSFM